jgi:translocation and assembly module TamB
LRWLRIGLRIIAVAALALILAIGALVVALQTRPVQAWLVTQLNRMAAGEARFGQLSGAIPTDMRLSELALLDPDGEWARIEDAALRLDLRGLLRGRIVIDLLTAQAVRIERQPQRAAASEPGGGAPWFPPIELRRLDLPSLVLEPAVIGQKLALAATGEGALAPERMAADLQIDRIDGETGHAALHLALEGKPAQLRLAVEIEELSGALLGALLPGHERLPLAVRLDGEGPLADWHGTLAATAGDSARLAADLALSTADGYRLRVDGDASLASLVPASVGAALGGTQRFHLAGTASADGALSLDSVRLDLAAGTLDGSARLGAGSGGTVAADLTIDLPDLRPLSEMVGAEMTGALHLAVAARGTRDRPSARLTVAGHDLTLGDVAAADLTAQLAADPTAPFGDPQSRIVLTGDGAVRGLAVAGTKLAEGDERIAWRLAGSSDLAGAAIELDGLTLEVPGVTLMAHGTGDTTQRSLSASLHLAVADLDRLSPFVGRSLAGHGTLDASLTGDAAGAAELRATGSLGELATGDPYADGALGGRLSLGVAAQRANDGAVSVDHAVVDGANLHVVAKGSADAAFDRLAATVTADLPYLAALATPSLPIAGHAHLDATLSGSAAAPRLDLALAAGDVALGDGRLDRLTARVLASKAPNPAGSLEAQFQAGDLDGRATARFALAEDGSALDLPELKIAAGGTTLDGSLRTALDSHLTSGRLALRSQDLSAWSKLAGLALTGSVELSAKLTAGAGKAGAGQGATLSLSAAKLSARAGTGEPAAIARLVATATIADLFGAPSGKADIAVKNAEAGKARLNSFHAAIAARRPGRFEYSLSLDGEFRAPIALASSGEVTLDGERVAARIAKLDGTLGGKTLRLAAPLLLTKTGPDLAVSGLDLRLAGGTLAGSGALKRDEITARLTAEGVPLAIAAPFIGQAATGQAALAGTAAGALELRGPAERLTGRVTVTARGVRLPAARHENVPAIDLSAEVRLEPGRVALSGRAAAGTRGAIEFSGAAPLRVSAEPFAVDVPRDGTIALRLNGEGRLEDVADLLPIGEDRLSGAYRLDLRGAGTLAAPELAGQISVTGGRYENLAYGTVLDAITVDIVGDRDRIQLRRVVATDGRQGTLTMSGAVLLAATPGPALDIRLALGRFRFIDRDDAVAHGSGELSLTGTVTAPQVAARLTVDDAQIYLAERLPPSVRPLEVTVIDSRTGEVLHAPAPPSERPPVVAALDIRVELPGQVFVRGRGLDSEWRGHFEIAGTSAAPDIKGALEIVRGTMNVLGKTLDVTRGRIAFVGGAKLTPMLDFLAQSQSAQVRAQIAVTGPLEDPHITLTSDPPLPQDQILSQLLFGRDASQLSPFEGLQMAQAAAEFASGGPGILDRLRTTIGLDRLSIGQSQDATSRTTAQRSGGALGNAAVSAGKYVANGVYLGVQQGVSGETGVRVEVEITPSISLNTTASATGAGNSVGVTWRRDY